MKEKYQIVRFGHDLFINHFVRVSLTGLCGYSQALTAFACLDLGIKVTVNNTSSLPDSLYRHSFTTCFIPIKEGNQVYEKQYLLDATYRQFFTTLRCNEGCFYEGDPRWKDKCGPDCGFYLTEGEKREFATELLGKGYVELTEHNAKIYGTGFSARSICRVSSPSEINRILGHSGSEYIVAINNEMFQEELGYTRSELQEDNPISLFQNIPTIKETVSSKESKSTK